MKLFKFPFLILLATLFVFNACVDDDFDSPPADGEPANIDANATIADVKAMHTLGGFEEITEDIVISGVVIGDDRSGNFYKVLVIQDTTAGIELRIDETNLFNEYGEGRRIYIKCKGLWLGDYNGVTQLGTSTEDDGRGGLQISRMPSVLLDEIIVKGQWNQHVTPTVKSISQLRSSDISTLVKIEDVQFSLLTCQRTYAINYTTDQGTLVQDNLNQQLESCANGAVALVRSSGFSNFATTMLPTGSGSITAIYTVFGDTKQLTIRDTDDAQMAEARCGNSGVGGELKTIREIREMYTGTDVDLMGDFKLSGVVISDRLNENITNRNMVIQDGEHGIVVRFLESHNFGLGEILEININGVELSEYNGLLQLNDVEIDRAVTSCDIGEVIPREATIQEIINNESAWQSTLIKIKDTEISGGSTFNGNLFLTDATNTINMFTQSFAIFKDVFIPSGKVEVTGIIGNFNGVQIAIRSLDDIVGGDFGGDPTDATISEVQALYSGSEIIIPNNYQITGTIISDIDGGAIDFQNIVIQDGSAGITVRFTAAHEFLIGEELTITVRGGELSEYNGLLQVANLPLTSVTKVTQGISPDPRTTTIANLLSNGDAWESSLVKILNVSLESIVTISPGTISTINDGTGKVEIFTRNAANYSASNVLPSSGTFNLTAMVSEFNGTRQLLIRNATDIE